MQSKWALQILKIGLRKIMVEYLATHPGDFYSVPVQVIGLPRIGCPSACLKQNCGHVYEQEHRYENSQRTSTAGIGQFQHGPVHWHQHVLQNQSQAPADRRHQALGGKGGLLLDDGCHRQPLVRDRY